MCEFCMSVGNWDENVQHIAKVDPKNILVKRATEGKTTKMKNLIGGHGVQPEAGQPPARGTTHRCYFNAPSRETCWKCSRAPLEFTRERKKPIAYLGRACNFAQDERAALTSALPIYQTKCPHCDTLQDFNTVWWENPPLSWRNANIAVKRVRQDPRGSGYPRLMVHGGEETSAATNWFPMHLILRRPLHLPGFVHENGRLYTNRETQSYSEGIMRQGRDAARDRGQVFDVVTDWNVARAMIDERHRRAVLLGNPVRSKPQFTSYHERSQARKDRRQMLAAAAARGDLHAGVDSPSTPAEGPPKRARLGVADPRADRTAAAAAEGTGPAGDHSTATSYRPRPVSYTHLTLPTTPYV